MKLPELSIDSLHALYRSGASTPRKIIDAIYDRIEAQPLAPVWISLAPREQAIAHTKKLKPEANQPLWGIPFAVKDNIDAAELPTTAGCPAYSFTAARNAFVVAQLQAAGAILIGKTNMDQFATGLVGTRSPFGACSSVFNPEYISGGSSSGSAVAVASGLVSFALGTDTAGSGRVPAAFNNIVGFKPSRGLLSTNGVVPACRSLDCVSIFARTPSDAALVFEAAAAYDEADPFSRELASNDRRLSGSPLRLGVPQRAQWEFFGCKAFEQLYAKALDRLVSAGHSLVEIDFNPFRATAELLYAGPYVAERFAAVGAFVKAHKGQVDSTVGSIIAAAEKWTAHEAYQALYTLEQLRKATASTWRQIDILVLPTAPATYKIAEVQREPLSLNARLGYYTNFANLLDLCAIALPAGFTQDGLPFGVTYFSPAFSDRELLSFSAQSGIPGWTLLGVVGAHLSGQPLNHQLTERGARLVRTTRTARSYRMFALTNTKPPKPGLIRFPDFAGPGIEVEVWAMPQEHFGSFVAAVPPPLAIGNCELADGSTVKGFVCEPYATSGMADITSLGGWRNWLAQ